jgi:hypothetical protein
MEVVVDLVTRVRMLQSEAASMGGYKASPGMIMQQERVIQTLRISIQQKPTATSRRQLRLAENGDAVEYGPIEQGEW